MGQPTPPERNPPRIRLSYRIVKSAKNLGIVIGVVAAVVAVVMPIRELAVQQRRANEDAEKTSRVLKVTSLTGLIQLLDRDTEIKARLGKFLDANKTADSVLQKAKTFATGSGAYQSAEFSDLREAGHHYEVLGALAKKGYVDVDLIYSIIDFPAMFWERTAKFREWVRKDNWNGPGSPLPDFWENFQWLSQEYEKRHRSREQSADTR